MTKTFLRRVWSRYSKLGKGRKKKQVWRRPTGRDNKMREKRRGYPDVVSIGYKKSLESRNKVNGKKLVTIYNLNDLEKIGKNDLIILGKVGIKKKIEIIKKIKEKKLHVHDLNLEKSLKQVEGKAKK